MGEALVTPAVLPPVFLLAPQRIPMAKSLTRLGRETDETFIDPLAKA
jgi:hypothetical protein